MHGFGELSYTSVLVGTTRLTSTGAKCTSCLAFDLTQARIDAAGWLVVDTTYPSLSTHDKNLLASTNGLVVYLPSGRRGVDCCTYTIITAAREQSNEHKPSRD